MTVGRKLLIYLQSLCCCYGNTFFLLNENPVGVFLLYYFMFMKPNAARLEGKARLDRVFLIYNLSCHTFLSLSHAMVEV